MFFNSLEFIFFFAVVYGLYLVLRHRAQNVWLLVASYWFYAAWDARFLGLIIVSTAVDFLVGQRVYESDSHRVRRRWLGLSLVVNLGLLFVFKYFNFFVDSFRGLMGTMGLPAEGGHWDIILPVGISFYTFQTLSYTIDIYRRKLEPTRDPLVFAVYVAYFPQLVAGPIERATRLLPQISGPRTITYEKFCDGAWLILYGFFLKVVVADNLALLVNEVFNKPDEAAGGLQIPLVVVAFAFQIYGDFYGYTNIARGISKWMGIELMENFRMPYFSASPSAFWGRWHISLSTWLRDYLYIPLGGNRGGGWMTHRNLMLTMLLGGLWHGASWNFVAWGAFHGVLLIGYRLATPTWERCRPHSQRAGMVLHILGVVLFFGFTLFGWLLFRVEALSDVGVLFGRLCDWKWNGGIQLYSLALYAGPVVLMDAWQEWKKDSLAVRDLPAGLRYILYLGLFYAIVYGGARTENAFIYFRF